MQLTRVSFSVLRRLKQYGITARRASRLVLGIETSCDDTGAAVLDEEGHILGESLNSQQQIHVSHGGIIPTIARDLHVRHIKDVVDQALTRSEVKLEDLSAIAVTVMPGLALSLGIGLTYGKRLVKQSGLPFIPIHHMQAHALTIRMVQKVQFPFLVLLISGGHCLVAVVQGVDQFLLLGSSVDTAPGDLLDKLARRLKLSNLPECRGLGGGQSVEHMATRGDPAAFNFTVPMRQHRDCRFSMSGIHAAMHRVISDQENKYEIEADRVLPNAADICASVQLAVSRHLCKRLQRAMIYCERRGLVPQDRRTLVVSGGVACNKFITECLQSFCDVMDYKMLRPPPKLCTDNGVMIAWNGVEKLKSGIGFAEEPEQLMYETSCPIGEDISRDVLYADIKVPWVKLPFVLSKEDQNRKRL